jgi:hypothetical protein
MTWTPERFMKYRALGYSRQRLKQLQEGETWVRAMDEITAARRAVGLPADKYYGAMKDARGAKIVCKCVYCGNLFQAFSHDLGDLEQVCKGDCGCTRKQDER